MTRASRTSDSTPTPAAISDERMGVNGTIAVVLTRAVGSMIALYFALIFVGGWMVLAAWGPLHHLDPYPFPFLLFLNNVVQLVLCLVILVGQRVLGADADKRSEETYKHAEEIFDQVADLQRHLDRHDRALSRGVSQLESRPHPWIEKHRVQSPPKAIDQVETANDRIAAGLTRRLGTMGAFYLACSTQVAWIVLAKLHIQRFDPYPFPFMSFLSTLAQLIFMIVIMVGQDVLDRTAVRRSEQVFHNAEAILHECQRMKARLTAQDRVIASLTGYVNVQVAERLAQAIHDSYGADHDVVADGQLEAGSVSLGHWNELSEEFKESNRAQAREIGEKLATIGCLMVPTFDPALDFAFDDDEVQLLARLEHERWMGERIAQGFTFGPVRGERTRPDLVPWDRLSDAARTRNLQAVRQIPDMLSRTGFQVLRDGKGTQDGPGEADFDPSDWDTLQRAMMASAVLVALVKGPVIASEMSALVRKLRAASIAHPQRLIRELAAASAFTTGLRPGTRYADYEAQARATITAAAAIIEQKAPAQLVGFREFLTEIATTIAEASKESGFNPHGPQRRRATAAAIAAVTSAAGLQNAGQPG